MSTTDTLAGSTQYHEDYKWIDREAERFRAGEEPDQPFTYSAKNRAHTRKECAFVVTRIAELEERQRELENQLARYQNVVPLPEKKVDNLTTLRQRIVQVDTHVTQFPGTAPQVVAQLRKEALTVIPERIQYILGLEDAGKRHLSDKAAFRKSVEDAQGALRQEQTLTLQLREEVGIANQKLAIQEKELGVLRTAPSPVAAESNSENIRLQFRVQTLEKEVDGGKKQIRDLTDQLRDKEVIISHLNAEKARLQAKLDAPEESEAEDSESEEDSPGDDTLVIHHPTPAELRAEAIAQGKESAAYFRNKYPGWDLKSSEEKARIQVTDELDVSAYGE